MDFDLILIGRNLPVYIAYLYICKGNQMTHLLAEDWHCASAVDCGNCFISAVMYV